MPRLQNIIPLPQTRNCYPSKNKINFECLKQTVPSLNQNYNKYQLISIPRAKAFPQYSALEQMNTRIDMVEPEILVFTFH